MIFKIDNVAYNSVRFCFALRDLAQPEKQSFDKERRWTMQEQEIQKVTYVRLPKRDASYGLSLSDEVQKLLVKKANEYGVTPQEIINDACKEVSLFGLALKRQLKIT